MRVTTSKSKNAESFYISKGYINDKGVSTSVIVRKLGTLKELLPEHGPTRDDVMAWAREEAKTETKKYKEEQKVNPFRLHSMLTDRLTMTSRFYTAEDIYFFSHFTTGFIWTKFAGN